MSLIQWNCWKLSSCHKFPTQCMLGYTHPLPNACWDTPSLWTHRHLWKHNLPKLRLRAVMNKDICTLYNKIPRRQPPHQLFAKSCLESSIVEQIATHIFRQKQLLIWFLLSNCLDGKLFTRQQSSSVLAYRCKLVNLFVNGWCFIFWKSNWHLNCIVERIFCDQ